MRSPVFRVSVTLKRGGACKCTWKIMCVRKMWRDRERERARDCMQLIHAFKKVIYPNTHLQSLSLSHVQRRQFHIQGKVTRFHLSSFLLSLYTFIQILVSLNRQINAILRKRMKNDMMTFMLNWQIWFFKWKKSIKKILMKHTHTYAPDKTPYVDYVNSRIVHAQIYSSNSMEIIFSHSVIYILLSIFKNMIDDINLKGSFPRYPVIS